MSQRRILVVEDERAIREMVCFNLGRAGYHVAPAADAREARASIADQRPDLVLMDWMLPDISGLELTRQLKRDPETKEIPVNMMTGISFVSGSRFSCRVSSSPLMSGSIQSINTRSGR